MTVEFVSGRKYGACRVCHTLVMLVGVVLVRCYVVGVCVSVCVASTPAAALVVWYTNTFHCAADGSRDLINSQHLALQPFAVSARACAG